MTRGTELFAFRERLLEYLYDEGAISHRVRVGSDRILTMLKFETTDYLVVCDSLIEAGLVKARAEGSLGEAEDLYHSHVWLTESGFQHVYRRKFAGIGLAVDISQARLTALLETKQIYMHNLNDLDVRRANYGLNVPIEITNQINEIKKNLAAVDKEISELQS